MLQTRRGPWWLAALVVLAAGCSQNSSMVLQGKVSQFEQEKLALTRQNQELVARASKLDQDNQELGKTIAQWQQQSKVFEDQLAALRDQLRSVNTQLAQAKAEKESTEKKVQTLTASMQRQGGVTITANNSFLQTLPVINQPETYVRKDGDVIRVELSCNRLFETGSDRLKPGAAEFIAAAAAEVSRTYPDQVIGVEGHTDNDNVAGGQWRSNQALSVARAMTVYDILVTRTRLQSQQLFVVGHGENHPVVSNATYEGKQRNRRVELVIYPDRKPNR
jgi:flagellar motor protein MotB